ncbi:MAG: hypothetical protein ACR2G7_12055 [Acidimicrobiales bacterium]
MPSRIEVELTSERPDGTWTWRAAGARQPKGVLGGHLLPAGARVGDVVRAEADIDLEGITVTTVLPPKGERREPARLEVIGPPPDDRAVTLDRGASRPAGRDDDRPGRPGRQDKPSGGRRPPRPAGRVEHAGRPRSGGPPGDEAGGGDQGPSRPHPSRPQPVLRPRPKKLRPGRANRDALLAELPHEQQPIAEQALRGGMPAVRTALEEQNAAARAEGKPEAPTTAVLAIAERLLPRVRVADWLDRAEAALADVDELALADLRSVVVSADDVARDEHTREPAARLKEVLERRTATEHADWLNDLRQSLESGRVVRALRLSSRSPDPGERLVPEIATRLAEAAGTAMTADIAADRWATLLDAVAYSAVRRAVTPVGVPTEPGDDLLAQIRKHARRVPAIAERFGITTPSPSSPADRPPRRRGGGGRPDRRQPSVAASGPSTPSPARPRRIPPPPVQDEAREPAHQESPEQRVPEAPTATQETAPVVE